MNELIDAEILDDNDFLASFEKHMRELPRLTKMWYAVRRWFLEWPHRWRAFREFFIRGRKGWAPSDTWSLDRYLARVIGEALEHLADENHGWPGGETEWTTPEEWEAELRKQAAILTAYSTGPDYGEHADVGAAIKRLGDYWGHLWD